MRTPALVPATLLALVIGLVLAPSTAGADAPAVGDPAPDFTLAGSDGKSYTLGQFKGERGLVLAWFPKAFTPG